MSWKMTRCSHFVLTVVQVPLAMLLVPVVYLVLGKLDAEPKCNAHANTQNTVGLLTTYYCYFRLLFNQPIVPWIITC